jgi:hypothetical protein
MKRSRFSEDQIIGILTEHEAGVPIADLCRKHGVSDASIHKMESEVRWNGGLGRDAPWMVVEEFYRGVRASALGYRPTEAHAWLPIENGLNPSTEP